MANVTLKINKSDVTQDRIDQLNQKVVFNDIESSLFELVCLNRGLKFTSIGNWVFHDDHYQINFVTIGDFILDKIKEWTECFDFLHGCRIHVFATTTFKHGYYQVFNGTSEVGYSVLKNRPDLVQRLRMDISAPDDKKIFVRRLKSTVDCWGTLEEASMETEPLLEYSFFSLRENWKQDELNDSLENFDPLTNVTTEKSLFV